VKRFLIALFCASTSLYGSAILVTDPSSLNTSDFVNWAKVGAGVSQTFYAMSTDYETVAGRLNAGGGQVVTACTTGCPFLATGGVDNSDALLLTTTGTNGGAPITLSLGAPVYGMGAYIEDANASGKDANTTFTVRIQAFYGISSVLTTTSLVTSNATGAPIFVGVTDLTQEITKVIFSLTDSSGNAVAGNFALDKLYIQNTLAPLTTLAPIVVTRDLAPGVPEPGMTLLVGPALLAMLFGLRKRSARA